MLKILSLEFTVIPSYIRSIRSPIQLPAILCLGTTAQTSSLTALSPISSPSIGMFDILDPMTVGLPSYCPREYFERSQDLEARMVASVKT